MKLPKYYIMEIRDTGKASLEATTRELVTCDECRYKADSLNEGCVYCTLRDWTMLSDGFCSEAEEPYGITLGNIIQGNGIPTEIPQTERREDDGI